MVQRSATELGALVRSSRVHRGLSQQELALRAGLTREWLGRLEAGAPRLEMSKVLLAMNALDIRIETPDNFPTLEDVRRADQVARDMALESQNLTDETYQKVLRRMVGLRLSAESPNA